MFGPNQPGPLRQDVAGHHREPAYGRVLQRLDEALRASCRLGSDWSLLFLSGSGTMGVEAALASLRGKARPPRVRGKFTDRMARLMDRHGVADPAAAAGCDVALETSASDWQPAPGCVVLDAVSSFPYYAIPPGTRVWVTVGSKQLGGHPVTAIVGVHEDHWDLLHDVDRPGVLNLASYRDAQVRGESPFTPAIPLWMDLADRLERLDAAALRRRIDRNSDRLAAVLGHDLVGARRCPALTVPKEAVHPDVARRFGLYGLHTPSRAYSVFTYAERDGDYDDLAEAIAAMPARPGPAGRLVSRAA